jgi:hypothetical protein
MCNPAKAVDKLVDSFGNVIDTTIKKIDSIIRDPMPTIETAALTYALGPSGAGFSTATAVAISQAAVSASRGGKIEDIALNAAAGYVGGKIGGAAGAALPAEGTTALVRQIVTSASAGAATTALRGGSMQQIMASGISGSVNAYVADSLKEQGFTKFDNKLISNASSAATNAILNGRSVADAISNSIAATSLTALIQGQVEKINENNKAGNSIADKAEKLSADADAFYQKNFGSGSSNILSQTQVSTDYLNNKVKGYDYSVKRINEAYDGYQIWLAKANADPGNAQIANQVNNQVNSYNNAIKSAEWYLKEEIPEAQRRYATDIARYNTVVDNYNNTYLNPLLDLTKQYDTLVSSNVELSKSLVDNVIEYEENLKTDYGDLVKQIGERAVADATNMIQQPVAEARTDEKDSPETKPVAETDEAFPEEKDIVDVVAPPPEPPKPVEPAPVTLDKPATESDVIPVEPEQVNLPSGVQLADAGTGPVSDSGSLPYTVPVGGPPVFADTTGADKVRPPFGYELMPSELNEKDTDGGWLRPAGAYYDETQNAWFMPNKDVEQLQQDLLTPPKTDIPSNVIPQPEDKPPTDAADINYGDPEDYGLNPDGMPAPEPEVATVQPVPIETTPVRSVPVTPTPVVGPPADIADVNYGSPEDYGTNPDGMPTNNPEFETVEITAPRDPKEPITEMPEVEIVAPREPVTPVTPTPVTPTPVTPVTPTPVTPVTPTPPRPVTPPKPATPTAEPQNNLLGLLALLEKPQQQATVQTPLADIKYYYDITGNEILPPTPIQNQKPTFQYAEGGTIEDLIRILRS